MIRGTALAAIVLVAAGSPSGIAREVAIPGKFFAPDHEVVLVGDTVTWRNGDSTSHTVTADDASFDSGSFAPGAAFSRTFESAGVYKYHCSIHRYMRGEIDVYALTLKAPGYAVPFGVTTALKGLAPPEVGQVTVRRRSSDGTFVDVGTAAVAADGSFRFPLVAQLPGVYVATAGDLTSGPTSLAVAARVLVRPKLNDHRVTVVVRTDPAQPGAKIQLQEYVLERFDFAPVARARLDARGRAVFRIGLRPKLHLRALLPTGVAGYGRAVSSTVLVRRP